MMDHQETAALYGIVQWFMVHGVLPQSQSSSLADKRGKSQELISKILSQKVVMINGILLCNILLQASILLVGLILQGEHLYGCRPT